MVVVRVDLCVDPLLLGLTEPPPAERVAPRSPLMRALAALTALQCWLGVLGCWILSTALATDPRAMCDRMLPTPAASWWSALRPSQPDPFATNASAVCLSLLHSTLAAHVMGALVLLLLCTPRAVPLRGCGALVVCAWSALCLLHVCHAHRPVVPRRPRPSSHRARSAHAARIPTPRLLATVGAGAEVGRRAARGLSARPIPRAAAARHGRLLCDRFACPASRLFPRIRSRRRDKH